jgi:hypothetical protein
MHPLMNETDRLPASPKSFKSEKKAPAYAGKLRKPYAMQGRPTHLAVRRADSRA